MTNKNQLKLNLISKHDTLSLLEMTVPYIELSK